MNFILKNCKWWLPLFWDGGKKYIVRKKKYREKSDECSKWWKDNQEEKWDESEIEEKLSERMCNYFSRKVILEHPYASNKHSEREKQIENIYRSSANMLSDMT